LCAEKRVKDLALEFDLHQSFFIFQLIAVLEQQWLGSHSNPERDRMFGFDSCFQQFVLKRADYSFAKARAPHLFASLIELMKLIEASRPIPDEEQHAADEEATLRLAGVEDEKIKENVRRVRRMERDKLRAAHVSPTLLPKLGAYFFQIVIVLQRLTGFAHVREMIYRANSVDIRHYLSHRADDPLLERLDHIEDPFFHSAAETLIQIVDDMVKAT
jgi:hypothetical protein